MYGGNDASMSDGRSTHSIQHARGGDTLLPKSARACINCRSLKVRCTWIPNESTCVKCKKTDTLCVLHRPQQAGPLPDYAQLGKRSDAQDAYIQSILNEIECRRQLAAMQPFVAAAHAESSTCVHRPDNDNMEKTIDYIPCICVPSLDVSSAGKTLHRSTYLPYYATVDFGRFKCPPVLKSGLFGPAEVTALFELYFQSLYPSFPILDPGLHTPQYLLPRSTLLFTTVLFLTTRLWTHRPKLHRLAQECVVEAIKEVMEGGPKTIETCQAFAMLSLFPAPHHRYLDSRSSMFIELAARIAQDLRLDESPPVDLPEREKLNRLRTWFEVVTITSFDTIRAGRPAASPRNNFTSHMSATWYWCSSLNSPYDFYTSAYADLLSFVSEMWGPMGPAGVDAVEDEELSDTILSYHQRVCDRFEVWIRRREEQHLEPTAVAFRDPKLYMLGYALRLIVLGVGVQHSLKRNLTPNIDLLNLSLEAANHVLQYGIERIYPTGLLRYVSEPQYLYVTYSAAFLINLLRPRLRTLLKPLIHADILQGVRALIDVLNSKEVALDRDHIAVVYAGFLESLLHSVPTGQLSTRNPSRNNPSIPTQNTPYAIPAHPIGSGTPLGLHSIDAEPFHRSGFTVSQFVANVALHSSDAYPAPSRGTWQEFPVDTGTW